MAAFVRGLAMRVAYLINQYPTASHSFIRREINAVEAQGTEVFRYSVRAVEASKLPDPRDQAERGRTVVLLKLGAVRLLSHAAKAIAVRPRRSLKALGIAFAGGDWRPSTFIKRSAYFIEAAALVTLMKKQSIDHLHAHFGTNPAMVARIANALSGIPFSFTVHGPDEFDAPIELDLRGKIADCAFCVAISSYGRSQLMRWSAVEHWPKIEVVRCGVDESFLQREQSSEITDAPHICTIARLSAQKGIPLLLEAAALLKNDGRTFVLTIVGDGEMRQDVERLIEHHSLNDCVRLAGLASSDQVVEYLLDSRAMVLPSFAEGLPVVIMEALALSRPVIVSAIAGTPELVEPSCGWLVPAGSIEDLAEAMRSALDATVEELASMGETGRERVLAMHDSSVNGRQMNALFQKAAAV
ncbi:MAG: glycosyltransferase [Pseudomonadota bacterium]